MRITENEIILDRELSELDKFAIGFSNTIEKVTKYVICRAGILRPLEAQMRARLYF